MEPALTSGQLAPLLGRLGLAPARHVVPLAGGSAAVFRIDLADGQAVVLKTYRDVTGKLPRREAFAAGLVAHLDLPVTRYLLVDETRALLPFRFAVTNHLPGVTANSLRSHQRIDTVYRQMGALLRRLHGVTMPAYGHFGEQGILDPVSDHADYMRRLIADAFGQFERHGGDPQLAGRLKSAVAARFDSVVPHARGPVFAHDDLHPGNVLVTESAGGALVLSGLIDFGNARAADPLFDLAKTVFVCAHEAPGSRDALLEGYGRIEHPDPTGALWFYTLIHRVVMWWWLRHVGIIARADSPSGLIEDLRSML